MKKLLLTFLPGIFPIILMAQAGHIMQGIGAVNTSMGGAATAHAADINGALQWNPAGITDFTGTNLSLNAGLFFSSPELRSKMPTGNGKYVSGVTKDDRPESLMPALAFTYTPKNSKHSFGFSAFGISGFGVTFPQSNTNPINMAQEYGGFGHLESDYQLMQVGLTYAYKFSDKFSIGITPNLDYAALELSPNPLASPSMTLGYPVSDKASAIGIGAQIGLLYNTGKGFKLGASYKTEQAFNKFDFKNKYLDGSNAPNNSFKMNYPAVLSLGAAFTNKKVDIALDYRFVDYENTAGFEEKGWTNTASVKGFGWKNISIVSAGLQYKGIKKLPLRIGYTYSSNPITKELAFFSAPATAIIENAFQCGVGYEVNERFTVNLAYHHGTSNGSTSGPLLNPMLISASNQYGAVPGSEVSYKMCTALIMAGINYKF